MPPTEMPPGSIMLITDHFNFSGSNPLFGLNTLGGALVMQSKDGHTAPGTSLELSGGSFGRLTGELEHGGSNKKGWHWYTASSLFFEDGWRAQVVMDAMRMAHDRQGWIPVGFPTGQDEFTSPGRRLQ